MTGSIKKSFQTKKETCLSHEQTRINSIFRELDSEKNVHTSRSFPGITEHKYSYDSTH